jgi:Tol biopolymer transport system component
MNPRLILTLMLAVLINAMGITQPLERIFYATFSPQDWDIYLSKDAGKSYSKFTDHPSLDYDAVISPDGNWVVFTSERSGIPKLYAKPIDATAPAKLLLASTSFQDQATFSPDGKNLAFVASHEDNAEIYLIPFLPDSIQSITNARNLTNHSGGDFRPAFSPDGDKIAFSSDRGHEIIPHPQFPFARQRIGDIYTVDINGNNLTRLTNSASWDGSPIWSYDGSKILFYSERNGETSLFEMNENGTDQTLLLAYSAPAISPKLISETKLAFTTWSSQQDFKILMFDTNTKEINPLFSDSLDLMFHPDIHPNGLMVFHGGNYPTKPDKPGIFGFDGNVLAKSIDSLSFADQLVNIYGVRRAFMAPPQIGNSLLFYDASDIQSFFEFLQPMGYSVFWLPLLVIILFFTGIILAIKKRKQISKWKGILFAFLTIILGILTGGIFLYVDAINPMPVMTIHLVMGALSLILAGLGWWQYKRTKRLKAEGNSTYLISRLYGFLFLGLGIFSIICSLFINYMVNTNIHFYTIDYKTEEKHHFYTFQKETNINPANFSVLDSKITPDGKSFIFTTGSFRGKANTQGDIWELNLETKKVTNLAPSPYNDGFADYSEDRKMVFRSGRSGHFDIYLKTLDTMVNLTQDNFRDNFPAISLQGDKIVFSSDRLREENEYKTMDIFLMKLTGDNQWTEPERISIGKGQNAHAHFSPDGNWVIYTTEGYGINDEQPLIQPIIFSPQMYGEIVAYNVNTKERFRLTHNKWEDGTPLWVR